MEREGRKESVFLFKTSKIKDICCSKAIIKLQWQIKENSENEISMSCWKQGYSFSLRPEKERAMPSKEAENKTCGGRRLR